MLVASQQGVGLSWLTFHDLRRANATALVTFGVDLKTAQTRLGPSDPILPLAVCAQAMTAADRDAADRVAALFQAKPTKTSVVKARVPWTLPRAPSPRRREPQPVVFLVGKGEFEPPQRPEIPEGG